jgi:hypothetical protein
VKSWNLLKVLTAAAALAAFALLTGVTTGVAEEGKKDEAKKDEPAKKEGKGEKGEKKGPRADLVGKVVGLSEDKKVLTVDAFPPRKEGEKGEKGKRPEPVKKEIKLTEKTEFYEGFDKADISVIKEGIMVGVWLDKDSPDTAAKVAHFAKKGGEKKKPE